MKTNIWKDIFFLKISYTHAHDSRSKSGVEFNDRQLIASFGISLRGEAQ